MVAVAEQEGRKSWWRKAPWDSQHTYTVSGLSVKREDVHSAPAVLQGFSKSKSLRFLEPSHNK